MRFPQVCFFKKVRDFFSCSKLRFWFHRLQWKRLKTQCVFAGFLCKTAYTSQDLKMHQKCFKKGVKNTCEKMQNTPRKCINHNLHRCELGHLSKSLFMVTKLDLSSCDYQGCITLPQAHPTHSDPCVMGSLY